MESKSGEQKKQKGTDRLNWACSRWSGSLHAREGCHVAPHIDLLDAKSSHSMIHFQAESTNTLAFWKFFVVKYWKDPHAKRASKIMNDISRAEDLMAMLLYNDTDNSNVAMLMMRKLS
jgi:hypothetical protein